jgi:hypothetical protein
MLSDQLKVRPVRFRLYCPNHHLNTSEHHYVKGLGVRLEWKLPGIDIGVNSNGPRGPVIEPELL